MTRVEVVAGILLEEGEVLLGRRTAGQAFPLQWEFPGGKVEPGETPEAALVREFREEVGIAIEVGDLYDEIEYDRPDRPLRIRVRFYLARRLSGVPRPLEVAEVAWVRLEDLPAMDFIPFNRSVVGRLAGKST